MENKIKKQDEMSLEQIKNINLADIKEIFYHRLYDNITKKYNIHTLYDLIKKSSNGELFKIIFTLPINNEEKNEQYKQTIGCVYLLMCKYFNQDPMLNKDDRLRDIKYKIVLDDLSVDRLEGLGITKLGQLLEMAEKNDFSILYIQEGLGKIVSNRLVKKINLIYNCLMSKDKSQNDENIVEQRFDVIPEIPLDINTQYNELQSLITENSRLSEELSKVQDMIDKIEKMNQENGLETSIYNTISNISIIEIKNFFSVSNFDFLVKQGFLTLGDLFNINFRKLLMNIEERPYNERLKIVATIKILRCKYLGEDPKIDNQTSYKDFEVKLGISFKTQVFLHNQLGINNLEELLQIIENIDFLQLNKIENEQLIAKLVVLYNFNKLKNDIKLVDANEKNNLLILYKKLRTLIIQHNILTKKINAVESNLAEKLQKVKSL